MNKQELYNKRLEKIKGLIEDIEREYMLTLPEKDRIFPVTGNERIKAMIYNLFKSEKYQQILSYSMYSVIMDIWLSRWKNDENKIIV